MSIITRHKAERLIVWGAWLIAFSLMLYAGYLGWRIRENMALAYASEPTQAAESPIRPSPDEQNQVPIRNPALIQKRPYLAVFRLSNVHTVIPTRPP